VAKKVVVVGTTVWKCVTATNTTTTTTTTTQRWQPSNPYPN
jgi:hypothetical protein